MAEKEKPLKKYSIRIKYEHLNPALQQMIGKRTKIGELLPDLKILANPPPLATWVQAIREIKRGEVNWGMFTEAIGEDRSLRNWRAFRTFSEGLSLGSLLLGIDFIKMKEMRKAKKVAALGTSMMLARTFFAKCIQGKHYSIVKSMKEFGILQPKYEKDYPNGWLNPTIVAKTHPAFRVNYRGDLIFPRMTRTEYARYLFQKTWAGKIGLNPWRWRGYLEPPQAPQPVREWAKEKAMQWAAAMRPKPAFGLSTVKPKKSTLLTRRKQTRRI